MKDLKEVYSFLSQIPRMMGMLNMPSEKLETFQEIKQIIREWKKYKDLEEQGKLLRPSYAVGDMVYGVYKKTKMTPDRVFECKVVGIKQENGNFYIKLYTNINEKTYSIWIDNWFNINELEKEFFLTEEEARAALKKMDE